MLKRLACIKKFDTVMKNLKALIGKRRDEKLDKESLQQSLWKLGSALVLGEDRCPWVLESMYVFRKWTNFFLASLGIEKCMCYRDGGRSGLAGVFIGVQGSCFCSKGRYSLSHYVWVRM